jgi:hypothetical protein
MTRIVTTTYRYKRPPRKRKPVEIEGPTVVTTKSSRRPSLGGKAAAEGTDRLHNGSARSIKHAARGSASYSSAASLRLARQR